MKMFLTRMGDGSKIVVSGDVTQVDLPGGVTSGLRDAWHRLGGIKGISFVTLDASDIVRHKLVQEIVGRYESPSAQAPRMNSGTRPSVTDTPIAGSTLEAKHKHGDSSPSQNGDENKESGQNPLD
jgi:phosphate starvation-inducible PhoH-like protein